MGGATGAQRWLVYEEYRTGRHAAPPNFSPIPGGERGQVGVPRKGRSSVAGVPRTSAPTGTTIPCISMPVMTMRCAGVRMSRDPELETAPPPWGDLDCTPGRRAPTRTKMGLRGQRAAGRMAGGAGRVHPIPLRIPS